MADAVVRLDYITGTAQATTEPVRGQAGVQGDAQLRADLALVHQLQAGSEDAYEHLIATYQQPVYNLVYRLLADPGDSCDVVQEVFLKVFRNVNNFRGQSSLKTWIYRIALNEANNRRRWFSRHKRHEVEMDREEDHARTLQECLPDNSISPFDLLAGSETQERIEEALKKLSPAFREAVVLRDIEELSYDEIAEILNISMGTVKSRILRGRDALRKLLVSEEPGIFIPARGTEPSKCMASGD